MFTLYMFFIVIEVDISLMNVLLIFFWNMKNLLPLKEAFEVLVSDMLFHINCGTRSVGEILIGFTLEIFLHIVARYYLVIIVFSNRRFFLFVCLFVFKSEFWNKSEKESKSWRQSKDASSKIIPAKHFFISSGREIYSIFKYISKTLLLIFFFVRK